MSEKLAEKKFKTRVQSENSFGPVRDYGEVENTMTLYQGDSHLFIEWIVGTENNPVEVEEIGIWTAGMKVADYDGVFELPKEAVELLKEYGLDTSEVDGSDDKQ